MLVAIQEGLSKMEHACQKFQKYAIGGGGDLAGDVGLFTQWRPYLHVNNFHLNKV